MSSLRCSRIDCFGMVYAHSNKHGYICGDCYNELLEVNFSMSISDFMKLKKDSDRLTDYDWITKVEYEFNNE